MREAHESDSDEEEEQAPVPSLSKEKSRSSVSSTAVSSPQTGTESTRLRRKLEGEVSDSSDQEIRYLRAERAELSQSLLTS